MKHAVLTKSALAIAGLLTLATYASTAQSAEFAQAEKELRIMSKIFETSLNEQNSQSQFIFGSRTTQATYLAKQGMVFTFTFGRNSFSSAEDWGAFGEGIGQFVGAIASEVGNALSEAQISPSAPVAPRAPRAPRFNYEFDYDQQFEVYQEQIEALEEMRERHHEQRERVRELQREIRTLERQSERESNNSAELEKTKKALQSKVEELNKKMSDYEESMRLYREKRDQKYIENRKTKSKTILTTLCNYGATLRSLKSDEHITLIFNNFDGDKAQIYVFEAGDVERCESPDKLLKQAIGYQL
jgi:hypothetical protein